MSKCTPPVNESATAPLAPDWQSGGAAVANAGGRLLTRRGREHE
jgi:hypothetical protein